MSTLSHTCIQISIRSHCSCCSISVCSHASHSLFCILFSETWTALHASLIRLLAPTNTQNTSQDRSASRSRRTDPALALARLAGKDAPRIAFAIVPEQHFALAEIISSVTYSVCNLLYPAHTHTRLFLLACSLPYCSHTLSLARMSACVRALMLPQFLRHQSRNTQTSYSPHCCLRPFNSLSLSPVFLSPSFSHSRPVMNDVVLDCHAAHAVTSLSSQQTAMRAFQLCSWHICCKSAAPQGWW